MESNLNPKALKQRTGSLWSESINSLTRVASDSVRGLT